MVFNLFPRSAQNTKYTIRAISNLVYSVTLDGSYGANVTTFDLEAYAGDTVTYATKSNVVVTTSSSGTPVSSNLIDTFKVGKFNTYSVYQFTMPSDSVVINLSS